MKIVYMGTPDFAVPPLAALVQNGYEVTAVVTQPDKPKGRGKTLLPTPVKEEAMKHDIPVYQPLKVREPEFVETLKKLEPDMIIVAAFGQIIPKTILDMPKYGCLNIHASLLPKYRGAAPIQQAVIDGEKESGVTIMQMGVGLDTGDMISQAVVPLAEDETGGSLFDKLAEEGAALLIRTLPSIVDGTAVYTKQPPRRASRWRSTTIRMSAGSSARRSTNWNASGRRCPRSRTRPGRSSNSPSATIPNTNGRWRWAIRRCWP